MKTKLTDLLREVEFTYKIENGEFYLVDELDVNLARIEDESYTIDSNLPLVIADRLSTYIDDYIVHDIEDMYGLERDNNSYLDLYNACKDDDTYSKELVNLLYCLAYPQYFDISDILAECNK